MDWRGVGGDSGHVGKVNVTGTTYGSIIVQVNN